MGLILTNPKPSKLKLDWATHEAAKFACEHWHYSKCIPAGKLVKVGVWENDVYIGVVIFSRGATPHIASPYGLTQYDVVELTRVALNAHSNPVSKVLGLALKFLKKFCPGIRLVVSYADVDQNHVGAIYQATNWIYEGLFNEGNRGAFIVNGKKTHPRSIGAMGGVQSLAWIRQHLDPNATEFITRGKHKYIMPMDEQTRGVVQSRAKPYPKRACGVESGTPPDQGGGDGASPIHALQSKCE